MAKTALSLTMSGTIQPERLAAITRELAGELARAGAPARLAAREAKPGERSGGEEVFKIALEIMAHGTAIIVAESILSYMRRFKGLSAVLAKSDGHVVAQVEVTPPEALAQHLSSNPPSA